MNENSELPWGWFNTYDIVFYRKQYTNLPNYSITIEVGCWEGRSICSVADIIKQKNIRVFCIDTFQGSNPPTEKAAKELEIKNRFFQNIKNYDIEKNIITVVYNSLEVFDIVYIPDESIDFFYIDGSHEFNDVIRDVKNAIKKTKKLKIIAGHDYSIESVKMAINDMKIPFYVTGENWWFKNE